MLFGAEWKPFVEFFVFYYFILEIAIIEGDDCLLWSPDFSEEFDFHHLQHFKDKKGFDVQDAFAKIANKWTLTDEIPRLCKMVILIGTERTEDKIFNFLQIL